MKRSHLITIVVLVAFVAGAWFAAATGFGDTNTAEYNKHIELAEDYFARGLFWKAAQEYQDALKISSSEEIWSAMLKAYASSVAQGDDSYDDYLEAAVEAVAAYGANEDFVLQLASLYTGENDFASATKVLRKAISAGLSGNVIESALISSEYAYEILWGSYDEYLPYTNGYYCVLRNGTWFYLDAGGGTDRYDGVVRLGPVGDDDLRVLGMEDSILFVDDDNIPQGKVSGVMEEARMYEEGIIPIKIQGKYAYYNLLGDKQFGDFEDASSFENGRAAVRSGDEWYFIDKDGERINGSSYEEIILALDGSWTEADVVLAKLSGQYHIFSEDGERIGDFGCTDIDVVTDDGAIAFCMDGLWGFVDTDGKIIIDPTFLSARSFSNGLAAVFDGTHWGFINYDGTVVIDYQFLDVDYFTEEGTCMVKTEDGWQVLERAVKG